ncbi:hypothetical protein [Pseudoclavibacter sp. VKM Ac-2867]|uniref:hypothetical protein n=1 Tax=Pseudoclavibacter sp. VKM Ac-2867 TaxID=2783829 RepID=UPI00188A2350|nr:hypothetical protein [Pseudoclavibacter sp. VKM Ac-2867]MBF4459512.1 hypothetical protein [Pseudoclavibacter sp. VKM Ac-2867]
MDHPNTQSDDDRPAELCFDERSVLVLQRHNVGRTTLEATGWLAATFAVAFLADWVGGFVDVPREALAVVAVGPALAFAQTLLRFLPARPHSDRYEDAALRWHPNTAMLTWAADRYGSLAGIEGLHADPQRVELGDRRQRMWSTTVLRWDATRQGYSRLRVWLRFDGGGRPRLMDDWRDGSELRAVAATDAGSGA